MQIIKLKPTSPGLRHQSRIQKNILCKNKNFLKGYEVCGKKTGGRSKTTGHITSWHRGGGKKTKSFVNLENKSYCIRVAVVYDATRSCFISINFNLLELKFYFTAHVDKTSIGSLIESNSKLKFLGFGSTIRLDEVPTGTILNCVYDKKNSKILYAKAAGTFCQLVQKTTEIIKIRLPSGKIVRVNKDSFGTIGSLSNKNHSLCYLGKAGKNRLKGFRSIVRGVAMNPVDHPHGGRTKGGRPSVSPWGKLTKGVPTKKKN